MATNGRLTTDEVLQFVLKNFISLHDEDKKYYVKHYSVVIDKLVNLMKENDKLFEAIYCRVYYAGSYYDGLKVGKPEEFDLDVVMKLPVSEKDVEFIRRGVKPPFTMVRAKTMEQLKHHPLWPVYRYMDNWTDTNGFLLQSRFREWMESVVTKTLNTLPTEGNARRLEVNGDKYLLTFKKTGPAMTFTITIPGASKVDVDFVPVIEFQTWPSAPVRQNPIPNKKSWFIVPKPNSKNIEELNEKYWRLAFHDQEREMINGKDRLKPICRLLKKLRDNNTALIPIASYYIKTLFLWETLERKNDSSYFSKSSLTTYFMNMLKMLRDQLKEGHIKYFWDDRYDLLSGMDSKAKENCEGRLNNIIKEIETKSGDDPKIIAKCLLTQEEYRKVEAYNSENRSPPLVAGVRSQPGNITNKMADVSMTDEVPAVATEASLETVIRLLSLMQQEMVEQKKVTQRVLGKIGVLQNTVDQLVDENAALRDELKLMKLLPKENAIANPPLFVPSLIDLPSNGWDVSNSPTMGDRLVPTVECSTPTLLNDHSLVDSLRMATILNSPPLVDSLKATDEYILSIAECDCMRSTTILH